MKKALAFALAFVMIFAFAITAMAGNDNQSGKNPQSAVNQGNGNNGNGNKDKTNQGNNGNGNQEKNSQTVVNQGNGNQDKINQGNNGNGNNGNNGNGNKNNSSQSESSNNSSQESSVDTTDPGKPPLALHTITFSSSFGGSLTGETMFSVESGAPWSDVAVPEPVPQEGYKFVGWENGLSKLVESFPENVTFDMVFTAVFVPITCKVTFKTSDIGIPIVLTVQYGTPIKNIAVPTPDPQPGYVFKGWEISDGLGKPVDGFPEYIVSDLTFKALYELSPQQQFPQNPCVAFVALSGGSLTGKTVFYLEQGAPWSDVTIPKPVPQEGYKFAGWENALGELVEAFPENVTSNLLLIAIFKPITYTVPSKLTPLSPETESQMKYDWLVLNYSEWFWWMDSFPLTIDTAFVSYYFGTYNGYATVILSDIHSKYRGVAEEEVAGYVFNYTCAGRIHAYLEGTFYTLTEAYEQNLLTNQDIEDIFCGFSKQLYPSLQPLTPLSSETEAQIKQDWVNGYTPFADLGVDFDFYFNKVDLKYYGAYNGYIALRINNFYSNPLMEIYNNIDGVVFIYSGASVFCVWKDGSFIKLDTAYEQGLLTKDDLQKIEYYYRDDYSKK